MKFLSSEVLDQLKQYDTPTVSNALEFFGIRPKTKGFMLSGIRSSIAIDTPMVGYAVTAKCSAVNPPSADQMALWKPYYEKVLSTPVAVSVIQDVDPVPVGSFWGEVNASTHKALGCVGTITEGGVRDLNEVEKLEFGYFSSCVLVSHAYIHLEEVDCPVEIGGMTVFPGDLIHADRHGAIVIPHEIAEELPEACRAAMYAEEPVIQNCREAFTSSRTVSIEDLMGWRKEMQKRKQEAIAKFEKK